MSGGGQGQSFGGQSYGGMGGYGGRMGNYGSAQKFGGQQFGGGQQSFGGGNPWMRNQVPSMNQNPMSGGFGPGANPASGTPGRPGMTPGTFTPQAGSPIAPQQGGQSMPQGGYGVPSFGLDNQMFQPRQTGGEYSQTQPIPAGGGNGPPVDPSGKIGQAPAFTGNSPNGVNYSGSNAPGAGWQEMLRQYAMRDGQANMNQYSQDRGYNPMWGNQLQPWEFNGRG